MFNNENLNENLSHNTSKKDELLNEENNNSKNINESLNESHKEKEDISKKENTENYKEIQSKFELDNNNEDDDLLMSKEIKKKFNHYTIILTPNTNTLIINISKNKSNEIYESTFNLDYLNQYYPNLSLNKILNSISNNIEEKNIRIEENKNYIKLTLTSNPNAEFKIKNIINEYDNNNNNITLKEEPKKIVKPKPKKKKRIKPSLFNDNIDELSLSQKLLNIYSKYKELIRSTKNSKNLDELTDTNEYLIEILSLLNSFTKDLVKKRTNIKREKFQELLSLYSNLQKLNNQIRKKEKDIDNTQYSPEFINKLINQSQWKKQHEKILKNYEETKKRYKQIINKIEIKKNN